MQTIPIDKITLYDLKQHFGLTRSTDPKFFTEWQESLPELTTEELSRLERIQAIYANLEHRSILESTVNIAIVSPLLDLAGFFLAPFYLETETPVEVTAEESGITLRGRMDILVFNDIFWVLVIESKRASFSLKPGISQVLSYTIASPHSLPVYAMVTNGHSFVFLKVMRNGKTIYDKSKEFILDQDQGLVKTLQILKQVANLTQQQLCQSL